MAGNCRPTVSNLGPEISLKVLSSSVGSMSSYSGLFNGATSDNWATSDVCYWVVNSGNYIEFITTLPCNIWRSGTSSWLSLCGLFTIYKYDGSSYADITSTIQQNATAIQNGQWEKTITNLQPGQYKFVIGSAGRLDSEWFVERIDIKSNVSDMQIGDCIPCRYTALTSGQVGAFSELGTCTAAEIPVTGTATPDGRFYLIMVGYDSQGRKKLVADRNIQTGISWDTLNSAGICSGIELLDSYIDILPKMTSNTAPTPYVVSASNEYTTNYKAFQAFDKSTAGWACVGAPNGSSWLKIDLGSIQTIDGYKLVPDGLNLGYPIKSWKLQTSNDGITWTDIHTITTLNLNQLYDIPNTSCRYLKWIPLSADISASYHNIGEITLYSKKQLTSSTCNIFTQLLTGGISATDTDNEWNKIICESNLGGIITPGDNSIWHWSGIYSWTSTISTTNNAQRIVRGNSSVLAYGTVTTNTANSTTAFRPLLLAEDTSTSMVTVKYMIQQGTNLYDLNSANYTTQPTNVSELHVISESLTDAIIEQSGGEWNDLVNCLNLFKGTKYKILKLVRNQ